METIQEVLAREYARIQQIQDERCTTLLRLNGKKGTVVKHEYHRFTKNQLIAHVEYTDPAVPCDEIVTPTKTMEAVR